MMKDILDLFAYGIGMAIGLVVLLICFSPVIFVIAAILHFVIKFW